MDVLEFNLQSNVSPFTHPQVRSATKTRKHENQWRICPFRDFVVSWLIIAAADQARLRQEQR
jgi:hypothetical protein